MILKLLGSIGVFLGCSAMGAYKGAQLVQRVKVLSGIEESLLILENEISITLTPLPDAMKRASLVDLSGIFEEAAIIMGEKSASESFKQAVKKAKIFKDEEDTLIGFAEGLKAEDKDGQLKNIALCKQRINKIKEEATERKNRLQKLYMTSGALSGAAAVIIML